MQSFFLFAEPSVQQLTNSNDPTDVQEDYVSDLDTIEREHAGSCCSGLISMDPDPDASCSDDNSSTLSSVIFVRYVKCLI